MAFDRVGDGRAGARRFGDIPKEDCHELPGEPDPYRMNSCDLADEGLSALLDPSSSEVSQGLPLRPLPFSSQLNNQSGTTCRLKSKATSGISTSSLE